MRLSGKHQALLPGRVHDYCCRMHGSLRTACATIISIASSCATGSHPSGFLQQDVCVQYIYVGYMVFTAVTRAGKCVRSLFLARVIFSFTLKMEATRFSETSAVFWDVVPCGFVINRRFGGTCRLHLQGIS
jgi:hypothetical protein